MPSQKALKHILAYRMQILTQKEHECTCSHAHAHAHMHMHGEAAPPAGEPRWGGCHM
jgi:hypothetical protein